MPAAKASSGAIAGGIVLGALIGLLWALNLATLASLGNSDAAGNALGEAYAAIQIIALWSLLTVLTVSPASKARRRKPRWPQRSSSFRLPVSSPWPPRICWRGPICRRFSGRSSFRPPSAACGDLVLPCLAWPDAPGGYCAWRASGCDAGGLPPDPAAVLDAQGGQ